MKNRIIHAASVLGLLICSACNPSLTPVAVPAPEIITIQVTPALMSLREQFHLCAEEQPAAGFVILETPANEIYAGDGLALRWGMIQTMPGFTAQLGFEEIAVIVPAYSPMQQISLDDLRAIYQGRLREWNDMPPLTGEIQAWAYTSGDDAQEVFEMAALDGAVISARVTSLAPDPAAVREAVASSSGAIGFLPRRWINEDVRALTVTGLSIDRLRQPILMISESEPEGPEKTWLLCLQEHLK